jgi:hypothetical protein
MFGRAPEPLGYDPAGIWGTVENPEFGVLMLQPWRIELVDGPGTRAYGGCDFGGSHDHAAAIRAQDGARRR